MTIWKSAKDKAALARLQDEAYHAAAVQEIDSGKRRDGLWAKAIIESAGSETRAKIAYLRLLVVAIRDDHYLADRLAEVQANQARENETRSAQRAAQRAADEAIDEARPKWHYYSNGKKYGPVSATELRFHISSESVLPDDRVIGPGMSDWIRAIEALPFLKRD